MVITHSPFLLIYMTHTRYNFVLTHTWTGFDEHVLALQKPAPLHTCASMN